MSLAACRRAMTHAGVKGNANKLIAVCPLVVSNDALTIGIRAGQTPAAFCDDF